MGDGHPSEVQTGLLQKRKPAREEQDGKVKDSPYTGFPWMPQVKVS